MSHSRVLIEQTVSQWCVHAPWFAHCVFDGRVCMRLGLHTVCFKGGAFVLHTARVLAAQSLLILYVALVRRPGARVRSASGAIVRIVLGRARGGGGCTGAPAAQSLLHLVVACLRLARRRKRKRRDHT